MIRGSCAAAVKIGVIFLVFGYVTCEDYSEEAAKEFLQKLDDEMSKLNTESTQASWDYESNITDYNLERQLEASAKVARYTKEMWEEVIKFPWQTFKDPDTRRQFQKYAYLGSAALPPEKYQRLEEVIKDMQGIYGKATVCDYHNSSKCDLHLEPDITELFAHSRNPKELEHLWTEWRKATGRKVRSMFKEYVDLSNEAARLNNFTDSSESWLKDYESEDFTDQIERLWQQVKPLYLQLHAYVRNILRSEYGEEVISKTGPIPAHLLGNVWAQAWTNLPETVYFSRDDVENNVTRTMLEQNYTPLKMFKVAEEFFTSLGLSPMPDTFWRNSILEKPADGRDLVCHASAWDFYDGKDFRIKQCTRVNVEDFQTVHHEMGHVQYYLQYKNLPVVYKEGANPGFHEAVGDVMAISVSTQKHLNKLGLLKKVDDQPSAEMNFLLRMALEKVAFLPFAYLVDQWRWRVFKGEITEKDYNKKWWELREEYQGVTPPSQRSWDDFDPGAKYHIVASVPYIRYFVSFIIQFQFHRSLCIAAGEFDPENPTQKPLHLCDIYENKAAGSLLQNMLKLGSSKPWPDAMEVLTGQRKMDAGALLEYFSELEMWLREENAKRGEYVGWDLSGNTVEDRVHYYELDDPDDYLEDNLGCSYAELVPQNDNAFGSPKYRRKIESWMFHPILRRSTETQFEISKNIDLRFNKKSGMKPAEKMVRRSNQQDTGAEKGTSYRNGDRDKDCPRVAAAKNNSDSSAADSENKESEQSSEKSLPKVVSKPCSAISKLLSSIGSSMPRPRINGGCTQKAIYRSTEDAPVNSDLMWNAEIMRVQAEKMLKSFDLAGKARDAYSGLLPDRNFIQRFGYPEIDPKIQILYQDDVRKLRRNYRPISDDSLKKLAKKSFVHYHYNIRTPVMYNAVVVKKPPMNEWVDDDPKNKPKYLYTTEDSSDVFPLRPGKTGVNYKNDMSKSQKYMSNTAEKGNVKFDMTGRERAQMPQYIREHTRKQRFHGANSSQRNNRFFRRNVQSSSNINNIFQIYSGVKYSITITKIYRILLTRSNWQRK